MPSTCNQKTSYPFKFRSKDRAIFVDAGLYTLVEICRVRQPRGGSEAFYEYRYLEGKSRYRISHAFENMFMSLDEFEAMKAEDCEETPAS